MSFLDVVLTFSILAFLALIVWSRIQQQKMLDTIIELKQIISEFTNPLMEDSK